MLPSALSPTCRRHHDRESFACGGCIESAEKLTEKQLGTATQIVWRWEKKAERKPDELLDNEQDLMAFLWHAHQLRNRMNQRSVRQALIRHKL
mmetsp:Transcript_43972/g.103572  ORF Transcript_43972/g.103572 Transcript_43972/m.103572 type:complete len:93 (+) Transcript_43972:1258-1536(+)